VRPRQLQRRVRTPLRRRRLDLLRRKVVEVRLDGEEVGAEGVPDGDGDAHLLQAAALFGPAPHLAVHGLVQSHHAVHCRHRTAPACHVRREHLVPRPGHLARRRTHPALAERVRLVDEHRHLWGPALSQNLAGDAVGHGLDGEPPPLLRNHRHSLSHCMVVMRCLQLTLCMSLPLRRL